MATFADKHTPDQRAKLSLTMTTAATGLTDVGDMGGLRLAAIQMSTAWTNADLIFKVGQSSGNLDNFYRLLSSSSLPVMLQMVTTANYTIGMDNFPFDAFRFIQLGGLAAGGTTAVTQAAERTIDLLLTVPGGALK